MKLIFISPDGKNMKFALFVPFYFSSRTIIAVHHLGRLNINVLKIIGYTIVAIKHKYTDSFVLQNLL